MTTPEPVGSEVKCRLVHHGAAADSSSKVLTYLPPEERHDTSCATPSSKDDDEWGHLVYASHAMINLAKHTSVTYGSSSGSDSDKQEEPLWTVQETLRTQQCYSTSPTMKLPTITALTYLRPLNTTATTSTNSSKPTLACGFSNGTLTVWNCTTTMEEEGKRDWQEVVLIDAIKNRNHYAERAQSDEEKKITASEEETSSKQPRSITDVTGYVWNDTVLIVSCSSGGVVAHTYPWQKKNANSMIDATQKNDAPIIISAATQSVVSHHTASTVQVQALSNSTVLVFVGTAAPRHNKIFVYSLTYDNANTNTKDANANMDAHFCGALTGHEDWVSCFAWKSLSAPNHFMLASGSQDFRIRLWKFSTTKRTDTDTDETTKLDQEKAAKNDDDEESDLDDQEEEDDEEDYGEHESRMEIPWQDDDKTQLQTSVSLEALLLGHEEPVTAVHWYPTTTTQTTNDNDKEQLVLLSSSMDRSILIWLPSEEDGIWAPMTRVGSAGGILGGSIGSTLLGYVNFQILPNCLIGHAYGGALHVWHRNTTTTTTSANASAQNIDNQIMELQHWNATPCVTGHFNGVTDLCWESTFGDYLLTVSTDQTCRLWAQVDQYWVEMARPQVHGYDLTALTSLSSRQHRHWIVSGADEKELRIFDAPMTTLRALQAITTNSNTSSTVSEEKDSEQRVERAYIPSLGLSNKASAADSAEEDVIDADQEADDKPAQQKMIQNLPLERDLGAMSLWLEKRKLFGHNTELFCVTSTLEAKTAAAKGASGDSSPALVASAAKARDVEAAAIRIWDPLQGTCLQTLSGGHKATVATLSFSPDNGRYLASSGKDRRLCIWKQTGQGNELYSLAAAKDTAHKRIIWGVDFCPYDSTILSSGSRDGNIKIWKLTDNADDGGTTVIMDPIFSFAPHTMNPVSQKPDSVTALAFAPRPIQGSSSNSILALGLECGLMELWSVPTTATTTSSEEATQPTLLQCFSPNMCHVATVTELAWRPLRQDDDGKQTLTLASCSADHGCRIFQIDV